MVLEDSRSEKKKEKFNFKKRKDCTIHSIKELKKNMTKHHNPLKTIKINKFIKY